MNVSIVTLGELRHRCLQCGGICHGAVVAIGASEVDSLEHYAAELGIERPVEEGQLRKEDGRCIFLLEDNRCGLHDRFGPKAKPRVCRQYPVLALRVGEDVRVAVDPGCMRSHLTWRGETLEPDQLVATRSVLPDDVLEVESAVLDICGAPDARLASVLSVLCGESVDDDSPPAGFVRRWCTTVARSRLAARIRHPDGALPLRTALAGVADLIDELDPEQPPEWALGRDEDEFAVDVVQRMVFMRAMHFVGLPQAAALLVAGGALLCAWADPAPEKFGPALSAWCRVLRAEEVVRELLPDGDTLTWLARG